MPFGALNAGVLRLAPRAPWGRVPDHRCSWCAVSQPDGDPLAQSRLTS